VNRERVHREPDRRLGAGDSSAVHVGRLAHIATISRPLDTGRFLFSATVELFGQNGFTRASQVGKHASIVNRVIEPA
jgi:hypothetical protein